MNNLILIPARLRRVMASCPIILSVVLVFAKACMSHGHTWANYRRPPYTTSKEGRKFYHDDGKFLFWWGRGETTQVFGVVLVADTAADAQVGMWNACM